ncbi:MAG: hypothetical protein ABFD75_05280 [Smithella sp.]
MDFGKKENIALPAARLGISGFINLDTAFFFACEESCPPYPDNNGRLNLQSAAAGIDDIETHFR